MTQLINELMSDEAVCRTAPATPGLLIMLRTNKLFAHFFQFISINFRVLVLAATALTVDLG